MLDRTGANGSEQNLNDALNALRASLNWSPLSMRGYGFAGPWVPPPWAGAWYWMAVGQQMAAANNQYKPMQGYSYTTPDAYLAQHPQPTPTAPVQTQPTVQTQPVEQQEPAQAQPAQPVVQQPAQKKSVSSQNLLPDDALLDEMRTELLQYGVSEDQVNKLVDYLDRHKELMDTVRAYRENGLSWFDIAKWLWGYVG